MITLIIRGIGDRQMMMQLMMMGNAIMVNNNEEEVALQRAIEESRRQDTSNPDNMSYEQLLELGDKLGKVSKGLKKEQLAKIPAKSWRPGVTKSNNCSICFEDFTVRHRVKLLSECGHEYHDNCINKWLESESRCPVCNKDINVK